MPNDANSSDPIATIKVRGREDHTMRGAVTIGRDPQADEGATVVVAGDPLVSKSHLRVDVDRGELIVTDLDSSNGTFLHLATGETAVPSDRWISVPWGAEIEFGDQRMTLEPFVPAGPPDPDITPVSPRRVDAADGSGPQSKGGPSTTSS